MDSPAIELRAIFLDHENGRLSHTVLVLGFVGDGDVDEIPRFEFFEKDMIGIDDGGAGVACRRAHGFHILGVFLSRHDDCGAAGRDHAPREALQSFDVGDAEGTPVTAVV